MTGRDMCRKGKDAKDLSEWGYRWGTLEDVAALKFEKEVGGVAAAEMKPEDQAGIPQLVDAQDVRMIQVYRHS